MDYKEIFVGDKDASLTSFGLSMRILTKNVDRNMSNLSLAKNGSEFALASLAVLETVAREFCFVSQLDLRSADVDRWSEEYTLWLQSAKMPPSLKEKKERYSAQIFRSLTDIAGFKE